MKTTFLLALIVSISASIAQIAQSATIRTALTNQERAAGCSAVLEGEIYVGDASSVISSLNSYDIRGGGAPGEPVATLCLNSPGGSLGDAIDIIRQNMQSFKTLVLSGHRCESACALIFMAGTEQLDGGESGYRASRRLQPGAHLGFHAPEFRFPTRDDYSKNAVRAAAELGLQAVGELIELNRTRSYGQYEFMPADAISLWLATPYDEMHYVTVENIVSWGIELSELPINSSAPAESIVFNVCDNIMRRAVAIDSIPPYMALSEYHMEAIYQGSGLDFDSDDRSFDYHIPSLLFEGSFSCNVGLIGSGADSQLVAHLTHAWETAPVPAVYSFPSNTKIHDLRAGRSVGIPGWQYSADHIFGVELSCDYSGNRARVRNVIQFVNIRQDATLRSSIVAEADLGETLTLLQPNTWWFMDTPRGQ